MSAGNGVHWVCEPNGYLEPKLGTGYAANKPRTVIETFKSTVSKHGDKPAMHLKRPVVVNGKSTIPENWTVWSWKKYWTECQQFAKSLIKLNVDIHKITNILGFNSVSLFILFK